MLQVLAGLPAAHPAPLSCRRGRSSLPARVAGGELRILPGELMGGAAPGTAGPPGEGNGGGEKDDFGFAGERFPLSEGVPSQGHPALHQTFHELG